MRIVFIIVLLSLLTSCISLIPENKLKEWALTHDYILASDCPKIVIPQREAQPHPEKPHVIVYDKDGKPIELTKAYLMEIIVMLFGTIEKYQYLVEIYEREYLNAGGQIMPNLTLDELKKLYLSRLSKTESIMPKTMMTGSSDKTIKDDYLSKEMTVEEFAALIEAYNILMEE